MTLENGSNLDVIIGHEGIISNVDRAIKQETLVHAHIICGEDGIGKSAVAESIALKILKRRQLKEYADVIKWKLKENKASIGVDEIRTIIEEINKKPYEGNKKVIIIYNSDKMTIQAQNAFLKTIEEPPKGVFIMLLCENLANILDTIQSRCQIHKLTPLSRNDMILFLKNKYNNLSKKEIDIILAFSDGIPGRAERYVEDSTLSYMRETVLNILLSLRSSSKDKILGFSEELSKNKEIWVEYLDCFISYIRDALVYKETNRENIIINTDKIDRIKELASMFSFNQLNDIIEIIKETRSNLQSNVNIALSYDNMLLKMMEV